MALLILRADLRYVDGGPTAYGIESTVLSLLEEEPLLLRLGVISQEEIELFYTVSLRDASASENASRSLQG